MKETHKVKYSDPYEIGFPDNWEIFKIDTKILCNNQYDNTYTSCNKLVDTSIKWKTNLFSPIGLTFKNNKASAIEASFKKFESDQERSIWLKKNRPLIYYIGDQQHPLYDTETHNVYMHHKYFVRYFPHAGKLSWFKYKLQFLIGKYNFKYIRPFLYRYLVMD
jgi:hypothetical protein